MSTEMKAYAVSCDKYYPGTIAHYAARDEHGARYAALLSMRKVGSRAKLTDIKVVRTPQFDLLAQSHDSRVCIEKDIQQLALAE